MHFKCTFNNILILLFHVYISGVGTHTSLPCISVSVTYTKFARGVLKPDVSLLCTEILCRSNKKALRSWEKNEPKTHAEVTRTSTMLLEMRHVIYKFLSRTLITASFPLSHTRLN